MQLKRSLPLTSPSASLIKAQMLYPCFPKAPHDLTPTHHPRVPSSCTFSLPSTSVFHESCALPTILSLFTPWTVPLANPPWLKPISTFPSSMKLFLLSLAKLSCLMKHLLGGAFINRTYWLSVGDYLLSSCASSFLGTRALCFVHRSSPCKTELGTSYALVNRINGWMDR